MMYTDNTCCSRCNHLRGLKEFAQFFMLKDEKGKEILLVIGVGGGIQQLSKRRKKSH